MNERRATTLVYAGSLVLTAILVLGLDALGANPTTVSLGFVAGLVAGSCGVSWVTIHYGSTRRHRDD